MLYKKEQNGSAANNSNSLATELSAFSFDKKEIRSFINDEGIPCFIAKDVCDALKHTNSRKALQMLDEDEKGVTNMHTLGGIQKMQYVDEAGLYKLIFRSNLEKAKLFSRWVTHEVLPQIRKQGCYIPLNANTEGLFSGLTPIQVNGIELICYTDYLRKIGRSTNSGSSGKRLIKYANHKYKMFGRNFITTELAILINEQKKLSDNFKLLQMELPFTEEKGVTHA